MKPKKTLSSWLTTRYQLIIRNEENFAEKTSMGFTYSKVILFSVTLFTGLFVLSLFMSKTILAKWFDPKHEQMVLRQELFELALKVDSLGVEVDQKDRFIANFQRVLSGDTINFKDPAKAFTGRSTAPCKAYDTKGRPRLILHFVRISKNPIYHSSPLQIPNTGSCRKHFSTPPLQASSRTNTM